jgi:hypothetical protein
LNFDNITEHPQFQMLREDVQVAWLLAMLTRPNPTTVYTEVDHKSLRTTLDNIRASFSNIRNRRKEIKAQKEASSGKNVWTEMSPELKEIYEHFNKELGMYLSVCPSGGDNW